MKKQELFNNVSLYDGSSSGTVDAPGTAFSDELKKYALIIISVITGLISIILVFFLIKIGFKIAKAASDGDSEGKSAAIKNIIWVALGAAVMVTASALAGSFASSFGLDGPNAG